MKAINLSLAALLLSLASLAQAEGGGDRTFARAMEENQKAMERYAAVSYTHLTLPTSDLV